MKKTILSMMLLLGMASMALAGEVFTAEKMWQMKRVGNPVVSPNGQWSVLTVTEYDIEKSSGSSYLWLLNNETGEKRQLTFSGRDSGPAWSPDGERLAFVSRRHDGPGQVYVLSLKGGEARQMTDLPVGVYALQWFPCGTRLAFAANILPEYNGDWDKLREMQKAMRESKVTAKATENVMYRFWDRWLTDGYYPRLFSLDLTSKEVLDLMPSTVNYFSMMGGVSYDICPEGLTIAVSMNTTEPPYERLHYNIFLLPADGSGEMLSITCDNPADDGNPVFSPCGNYILYGKQSIYHFYADRVVMTVFNRQTMEHRELSAEHDLSCGQWFFSENGRTVYFIAEDRGMQSIFSLPFRGGALREEFRGGTNSEIGRAHV